MTAPTTPSRTVVRTPARETYGAGMNTLRLALALLLLGTACQSPTAPEPRLAACSLTLPSGFLCFTPCPPGTEAWAHSATLGYSATNACQ